MPYILVKSFLMSQNGNTQHQNEFMKKEKKLSFGHSPNLVLEGILLGLLTWGRIAYLHIQVKIHSGPI